MELRFRSAARAAACVLSLAMLSACGGGSTGGGTPITPPIVVTTPAPGTLSVPGHQSSGGGAGGFVNDGKNPSTYAVTSNPSGEHFTLAGQSYTTPATVTPAASTNALAIVFSSGYTVPVVQVYDGPHTVFYNAASDSQGTVSLATLQSIQRGVAASAVSAVSRGFARAARRPVIKRTAGVSDVDATRVAVRLSAAALQKSGRTPDQIERAVGARGQETLSATADRLRVVTVPAGMDVATFTRILQAQPEVAEVTPVHRRFLLSRPPTTVSDPYFNSTEQWYTFATGANYAWSYNTGAGARVAIIDTGIDENNTDLTSQVGYQETAVTPIDNTPNVGNGNNPTCSPISSDTTVVTPNTAQDDDGHGTNVAGIAIAKANTAGFAGAAWGATLLEFKIFPDQNNSCFGSSIGADTTDEAVAIADAIAHGADVISLSLGASSFDTVEFNAIQTALAQGVVVVAAAGNSDDGSGIGTLDYPAAYPGVISVGASALKDQYYGQIQPNDGTYATSTEIVASYSQYGPSLSVVAPGGDASSQGSDGDILHWIANYSTTTTFIPPPQLAQPPVVCLTPNPATSCVILFNGTSMATPQVSATAAMLIAEAGGHHHLTPAQVQYVIESTADNINDPKQGHGRLNSYRALASLIRDTSAYSGPMPQKSGAAQLIAFAYTTGNTNKPAIIDATFLAGVPVATNGTFRIADVPAGTGTFKVAVWYDGNGDGYIDVGDQIGTASATCSSTAVCAIGTIAMQPVTSGYYLP